MRKFLSVIMVIAMLATSILPAIANVAAADGALTYDVSTDGFVDNGDGTATAEVDVAITNNPGGVDTLAVVLYYTLDEIETGDYYYSDAYADYADGTDNKVSTNRNLKSYFAYAGISTSADLYGTSFEVVMDGDGTIDDEGVYVTFEVIALDAEAVASGAEYNYGIIVQALDVDGEEITVDPVYTESTIAAVPEDPYATKYDVETFADDQFVINVTGTKAYENGFVEGEIPTVDVNVEFYGNNETNNPFGVWGYTAYLYYPEELTAIAYTNGEIFKESEMQKFADCATNLVVADELTKDPLQKAVKDAIKGFDYVGYDSYAEDGIKISAIQHLGTNWYDCTFGDGVVTTITFQLPEDAAAGDKWEIGICADDTGAICDNGGSTEDDQHPELTAAPIAANFDNGYIEVVSVKEESFEEFTFSAEDITISADNTTATVNLKVEGLNAEDYPYGFWSARLFVYYPSELSMVSVEEGDIVPEGGFTLGNFDFDLVSASKDESMANNLVVKDAPKAFAEKGFDWENEDFRLTTVYFQALDVSDQFCIKKDGHYATLTFKLPEGAAAGDSWYVGLATCSTNADVTGYLTDPADSSTVAQNLAHSLDDGSIALAGDVVVEEHVHELEYTAAVEAGCHYTGNSEYWYCAGCDTVFADEACTIVTNRLNVVIPATGSSLLVAMDAVEPGCHYDGNIAYWICYECNQVWTDEALTQLSNIKNVILPATGSENLVHVDYLAPTFEADGNIEYWYCEDCGQVWQDEALTQLTNRMNVIIPRLTQATVTVGTATVVAGYDANVAITIANNPGLFIGKFIVTYDASALTLVEATNGDLFADEYVIINTETEGQIIIYLENAELADAAGDGVLANLVFATEATGDYELAIEAVEAINVAGEDVAIEVAAGKVSVTDCAHEGEETTYVVVTPATVYEEGYAEYICNHCEGVAATETLPKLAGIVVYEWQEAVAGEQQAYAVELLNNPGVWALSATFAYDPYVLEFVRVDSYLFTADEFSYSVADGVVTVYVEADDLNNVEGDGAAFFLVFDSIFCGYSDIDVELVADNTINAAGENVAFEAVDGSVIVKCNLQHSPFVAPSDVNGWLEYWYCEYCGAVYADADGRWMTNRMNCYIPANSITLDEVAVNEGEDAVVNVNLDSNYGIWSLGLKVTFDAEALTLKAIESGIFAIDEYSYSVEDGVITIYVENADIADVTDTGAAFSLVFETAGAGYYEVAAELIADNTINASSENVVFAVAGGSIEVIHVCTLEYVEAVEATCCQNGMQEYWYCTDENCGAVYSDAEGRYITNRRNLVIPATAEIVYVEAVEATCHQNGSAAYYYCSECDAVYDEDFILTNRKNLTIPYTAEIIHVDALEATCCQTGNVEYWYCADCQAVFTDAGLTQLSNFMSVKIPATAEIAYVEAVEATCHQNGSAAYYYCTECDAVYDEDFVLTNRKNLTIPYTAEIVHIDAVEAGCHYTGNVEYWYCADCQAVFTDAGLTQLSNFKSVIIPELGGEVTHVEAVEATCHQNGNIEYWYCAECEQVWADEARTQLTNIKNVVVPATAEIVHIDAVEAGCHYEGNIEYWYCSECDAVFADAALTQLTNRKNIVIPELGGDVVHVDAVEAVCHQNGNIEYWYCEECEQVWQDWALTQLTNFKNVIVPAPVALTYVEAVEATCHQNGSAEYWYCAECEAVFADAAGTQLTNVKNLTIPYTAEIIHVDAVEATCCQTGNIEYWYCADCQAVFTDAALTQLSNFMSVKTPATAEIAYVEAVEATCHQNGSAAYFYCTECDAVYDEDFVLTNRKNLTIPYTAEIIHVDAVDAVCHQTGNVEYWYCADCEAVFTDAALTQLSNFKSVITPALVELTYVAAADATCTVDGNVEYWYCAECDAVFADAMGAVITNYKNVVVPALGHVAGDKVVTVEPTTATEGAWEIRCTVCNELLESGSIDKIPATFITKASGTDYVKSVTLEGEVITVVTRPNAPYVKIAVGYEAGTTVDADYLTMIRSTYSYLVIENGVDSFEIVATNADGLTKTYTVVIDWVVDFYTSYVGGYTVDSVVNTEETFNIYAKPAMNNATIGFALANGVTYEASEGLQVVVSGGKVYFKALESAENDTYTVTFTAPNGATKVVTLNYVFDYAEVEGVQGGYMVDGITLEAGNIVNITAPASNGYASFRFVLKNTTSSIEWDEETVDAVIQYNIHWFKIYNDGTGSVTKTFVVTNNATGVVDTYTVNVTFGSNN